MQKSMDGGHWEGPMIMVVLPAPHRALLIIKGSYLYLGLGRSPWKAVSRDWGQVVDFPSMLLLKKAEPLAAATFWLYKVNCNSERFQPGF